MARNFLKNDFFHPFLNALSTLGELHGPLMTEDGVVVFDRIDSPGDLWLDYQRTLIPPKKYLLPPSETILTFSPENGYRQPSSAEQSKILLGLHPCDLMGIAYLDKVLSDDPLYASHRHGLILVGLSCEPDEACFCGEVGTGENTPFDLFLQRTADGYHLIVGSMLGDEISPRFSDLLTEREPPPATLTTYGIEEGILAASARGDTFQDSPLWDDFAARCLSCGACSACCPTCYCFDIREYGSLDGKSAIRLREWDNCLFTEHGKVSGGVDFRKDRRDRFLYRYQHKYLGFGPTRGMVSCVGCGRCRVVCPVGIDLLDLFREGRDDECS